MFVFLFREDGGKGQVAQKQAVQKDDLSLLAKEAYGKNNSNFFGPLTKNTRIALRFVTRTTAANSKTPQNSSIFTGKPCWIIRRLKTILNMQKP